jgi:hypothetical protein
MLDSMVSSTVPSYVGESCHYSKAKAKSGTVLLLGGAVWKPRRCHCGVVEAKGRTVDVLRHVDGSLERVAAPKADLVTPRVAIRGRERRCNKVSL